MLLTFEVAMKQSQIHNFLDGIETYCKEHAIRMTQSRREVARIIASSNCAIGAYDILEKLSDVLDNPKPPTVYRAIDFLMENQFIHKVESLNAFIACNTDHRHSGAQFLVCDTCGRVEEAHICSMPASLASSVKKTGFVADSWNLEVHGKCEICA